MSTITNKYRPVLTAKQILHILKLAKTEQPAISAASFSLIASLAPFQAKIDNAGIIPAYTIQPIRPSNTSLEELGGAISAGLPPYNKEDYWERCYTKYSTNPVTCNLEELHAAKEHMYLNDLMSSAELEEFEKGNVTGVKSNE